MKHVMLDLETWGVQPFSVITMIGAVHFDPNSDKLMDSFEVAVDPISSQKAGLRIDADTVAWWMDPERDAPRKTWFEMLKFELPIALDGFEQWLDTFCPDPEERVIWGNGSDFDNALLRQAYRVANREAPWEFRKDRCFRTLKGLSPVDLKPSRMEAAHTALADATFQAQWAQNIVRKLGITI